MEEFWIGRVQARQKLDFEQISVMEAEVTLENGVTGQAFVSGGILDSADEAVVRVNEWIAPVLQGLDVRKQGQIDDTMLKLCETVHQVHMEMGEMMGVSIAAARAAAKGMGMPLYRYIAEKETYRMPVPLMELSDSTKSDTMKESGRKDLLLPVRATSFQEAVQMEQRVYDNLKLLSQKKRKTGVQDAVQNAGYAVGRDIVRITGSEEEITTEYRTIKQISLFETGTLTEVYAAIMLAQKTGYGVALSGWPGETAVADIAVAMEAEQVILGTPCSNHWSAVVNRLLWIEEQMGKNACYENPFSVSFSI